MTPWKRLDSASYLFLFSLLLPCGPARAQAPPEKTLSPYFVVTSPEAAEAFPLRATSVTANVSGVIADVRVVQTYVNVGPDPIHARYVFPASTRAAVHGLTIRVGDQAVVARISERQQARAEFEHAKAAGKTASLLEQQRPNVFTMSVSNILPQDEVEVELRYTELLVPTDRTYAFVYPAVVAPRYDGRAEATVSPTERWIASPFLEPGSTTAPGLEIHVNVSAGLPLADVRCLSHEVEVAWDGPSLARVHTIDRPELASDRDFVLEYRLSGQEIQSGLLLYRGADESFFLLMVQPPEVVRASDVPPREFVFVLDVSGSMDGFPLDTAKALLADLIGDLRDIDRFNVVLFAGGSSTMAPASVPATRENVEAAIRMIEGQRGGGATELRAALEQTIGLPRAEGFARTVAIVTDGFVAAESEAFELVRQNLQGTSFFSFGIGSSVNRYLIEGLARAGQGEPFVVLRPEDAPEAAVRFRRYIESPVLSGIDVTYHGFDVYDVEPQTVPDVLAERPVVVFGKWRGDAVGDIVLTGRAGAGPYAHSLHVEDAKTGEEHAALPRLWARSRISRLADFPVGPARADTVEQVTSLGLTYSLLTPYTSFVAVLDQVRNPGGAGREVDQPSPVPRGVSHLAVGGGYAAGSEPALWLVLGIAALTLALGALGRALVSGART